MFTSAAAGKKQKHKVLVRDADLTGCMSKRMLVTVDLKSATGKIDLETEASREYFKTLLVCLRIFLTGGRKNAFLKKFLRL